MSEVETLIKGRIQCRTTEIFRELEHLANEEMLRKLHLFSLEKERQNDDEPNYSLNRGHRNMEPEPPLRYTVKGQKPTRGFLIRHEERG